MPETYCAPTPQVEAELAAPAVLPVAAAANMTAPTGLTAVAPADFPLPCTTSQPPAST